VRVRAAVRAAVMTDTSRPLTQKDLPSIGTWTVLQRAAKLPAVSEHADDTAVASASIQKASPPNLP
jgi:hypothetical protein